MKRNRKSEFVSKSIAFYFAISFLALFFIAPVIWMLITSLQPYRNLIDMSNFNIWESSLKTYVDLFHKEMFLRAFKASVIITVISTALTMIVSVMCAYATAFFRFKGKDLVSFGTLSIQMAPAIILIIPLYIILTKLGLSGSYPGITAVFVMFMAPMTAWMMRGFFQDVPYELYESARIDGCTKLGIMYRIVLPVVRPGVASCAIFTFMTAWNEVLIPLVLSNSETGTLTMFVTTYATQYDVDFGGMAAAGIFTSIPGIILVIFFNRQLIDGLVEGAVKG